MKTILTEHMSSTSDKTKADHALQMTTMQSAKDRQDEEMAVMRKEISTLTRALTTLTHKMVDKKGSTRRSGKSGGGHESDGGYETDESEKENTRPRKKPKRKHREVEKESRRVTADERNKGDWTVSYAMKYDKG